MIISRYCHVNTRSESGSPERVFFNTEDVIRLTCWVNGYGNPTYMVYLTNKSGSFGALAGNTATLLCVDDYGCENDLQSKPCRTVNRKKEL